MPSRGSIDPLGDDRDDDREHDRSSTMLNQQLATIVIGAAGLGSADRLVGDLGDHARRSGRQDVDAEDRADAGEARRPCPASGCRPTLSERRRAERDEDQVAGVGGDAREHADEDRG